MKLTRKQRRAKKLTRPNPMQSPQQQMTAFLQAPGKFHIVELPEGKSFVVKVTDDEMPLFVTICAQLRAVLGYCEARGATPVNAHVADTQEIARSSAESTRRIREARARQEQLERAANVEQAERPAADAKHRARAAENRADDTVVELNTRRRAGRHRKPDPDTVLDMLAAGADADDGERRIAALQLAAAQDEVAAAHRALDEANERYAAAAEQAARLNNERVLSKMAERAAEAIEKHAASAEPDGRQYCNRCGSPQPTGHTCLRDMSQFSARCPYCPTEFLGDSLRQVISEVDSHIHRAHPDKWAAWPGAGHGGA